MRQWPGIGSVNAALVSVYYSLTWGRDAFKALTSPFAGLDDHTHWATAVYFHDRFDSIGVERIAAMLGGLKFAVVGLCVAYLVAFVRGLMVGREPARHMVESMLMLATGTILVFAMPALMAGDPALIRLYVSQFLMVIGAAIVLAVEHPAPRPAEEPDSAADWLLVERI